MKILLNKDKKVIGNDSLICSNIIIGNFEDEYIVIETTKIYSWGDTTTHVTSQTYSTYDEAFKEVCNLSGVDDEGFGE